MSTLVETLFSLYRSNKTDGINKIRRLAQFHSDVLAGSVHAVTLAMIAEVKNLRTQVARLAIVGLGDLFTSLKKAMDPVSLMVFVDGVLNSFVILRPLIPYRLPTYRLQIQ